VALTFSGAGDDPDEFASWLEMRRDTLRIAARQLAAERERLVAKGYIGPLQAAVMRRGELGLQAELDWHEELTQTLAETPAAAEQARLGRLAGADPVPGASKRQDSA
jgi:hypothetical protein